MQNKSFLTRLSHVLSEAATNCRRASRRLGRWAVSWPWWAVLHSKTAHLLHYEWLLFEVPNATLRSLRTPFPIRRTRYFFFYSHWLVATVPGCSAGIREHRVYPVKWRPLWRWTRLAQLQIASKYLVNLHHSLIARKMFCQYRGAAVDHGVYVVKWRPFARRGAGWTANI